MKARDIIFMIVFAPVLYQFYFVISQRLSTELAIMLTVWLVIIIPTFWFTCKRGCKFNSLFR
jgi:hypothetical protein